MHDERLGCYKFCGSEECMVMDGCKKKKLNDAFGLLSEPGADSPKIYSGPQFAFTPQPKPIGYWYVTSMFSIAVYGDKPEPHHIKNHELLLGWKWKDAE